MKQHRSSSEAVARVAALRKRLRDRHNEINLPLGDGTRPPICFQTRAGAKDKLITHRQTLETISLPVDPDHLLDVVESMRQLRSPVHLEGRERPNAIRLKQDARISGRRYSKGDILIVEGTHRVAAAWRLGWSSIPVRVVDGTAQDVADLATVSNTKAIKPARTKEDIKKKMLLYKEAHGRLPTVAETEALCRVSRRTVYRVRTEYREELGLDEPVSAPEEPSRSTPPITEAHRVRITEAIGLALQVDPPSGCDATAAKIITALLNTDDRRRDIIARAIQEAVTDILDPDDHTDF